MSDRIYTVDELQRMMVPVFKHHDIRKAVLFGSYSKGKATEKSDVDLLVDSGLHGLKFVGMVEDLRGVIDKEMDVFDTTHIEQDSPIDFEIKKTGVLLYEK